MAGFLVWTVIDEDAGGVKVAQVALAVLAIVAVAAAVSLVLRRERDGWAFALSAGAIALLFSEPVRRAVSRTRCPRRRATPTT